MQSITAATAATQTLAASTPEPRLVRAAHEFEAQMMKELIKPLNQASGLAGVDEDGEGDSGSVGALGEFASEALGRALSERGGFGIASSIVKELSGAGHRNGTIPVTGKLRADTVNKALK